MHEIVITIGDWSEDGHGCYKMFKFESSHSKEELQEAYKKSCIKSGLSFDHEFNSGHDEPNAICVEYQSSTITAYQMFMLHKTFRLDISDIPENVKNFSMNGLQPDAKELAHIILWFVGCSLENFTRTPLVKMNKCEINEFHDEKNFDEFCKKTFNGWWGELNVQMGYGIFNNNSYSNFIGNQHSRALQENSKLYFFTNKSISGYLNHFADLEHVKINPRVSLDYNDNFKKSVKEWANTNFNGRVFNAGKLWFYEDINDIHLIEKHLKTTKFISEYMPYCITVSINNSLHNEEELKKKEIFNWCENLFGDELYPDSEYPQKMIDFNEDARWTYLSSRKEKDQWDDDTTPEHKFYFKNKDDAIQFKLMWG
jgi:hypothetical protein